MTTAPVTPFEGTLHTWNTWLDELMSETGSQDLYRADQALKVVLQKSPRADSPAKVPQMRFLEFADRELIRAAHETNLDAATLAFNPLTISCLSCDTIVRDAVR